MGNYYILDENRKPKKCELMEWAMWFETTKDRHVANTEVGAAHISTVFLGMDHSFGRSEPILYETMIFGGRHSDYQERYATEEEAIAGHARAIKLVEDEESISFQTGTSDSTSKGQIAP